MRLLDALRAFLGLVIGAFLYVPLSLIPIVGPIASGYAQGMIMRTSPGRAFLLVVLSGMLGFFLSLYIISTVFAYEFGSLFSWIALWMFFAWNLMQTGFNGIGCVFASLASGSKQIHPRTRQEKGNSELDIDIETFIICPSCGISNPDGSVSCASCARSLQR